MKQTMIYRISYNKQQDAFETYFYIGTKRNPNWDDFKHEATYMCLPAWIEKEQKLTEETELVSWRILSGIERALEFGYKIEFLNKPE